ncbi:hydrogenase expression/synthesis, HypA [Carbonactinospora thermoautotrophica]|uniref:Hydrogenase maturation factor HypA n=1 Tax=Carbonactinospora thermoautotrophica TaxID=1469144 RepID=A0A132N9U2_9ACTN|nr:hydrogenase maturation nickel metallochaperone HypA [Carbonactinospora thermoautotrophica]KWX04814.1 hydrogenase expression/synthesis, HypA [Carbonactinospora thermoautotrophica]KWX06770.1 hydrogenase expression/synthesis, HypA [Carbonactinospora thermoautotrophica]
MHEVGLCEAILDAVERRAAGRPVRAVKVRVGALHRVVDSAMDSAFAMVATGTVAEHARIDLVVIPVRCRCPECGAQTEAEEMVAVCPRCGATGMELLSGDELLLESITLAPGRHEEGA